jgi:MFS family permease
MGGREALPAYRRAVTAGVVVYAATVAAAFLPLSGRLSGAAPWIAGVFPLASGLALYPVGWVSARWGRRPTTLMALGVLGAGQLGLALLARGPLWTGAFSLLSGLGSGGAAAFSWSVEISDIDDRGKRAGAVAAAAGVFATLGLSLGGLAAEAWSWVPNTVGALLAAGAAAWVAGAALPAESDCPPPSIRDELRFAFSSRPVLGLSGAAGLGSIGAGLLLGAAAPDPGSHLWGWATVATFLALGGLARLADAGAARIGAGLAALVPVAAGLTLQHLPQAGHCLAAVGVVLPLVAIPTAMVSRTPEMLRPVGYLVTQAASLIGLGLGLMLAGSTGALAGPIAGPILALASIAGLLIA